jgi:nucleoside phosphorylase
MVSQNPVTLTVADLRNSPIGNTNWFEEDSPRGLAGRCLLDALEYLHTAPKYPARFWHVVNAHAIRLVHRCLTDRALKRTDVLDRMKRHIEDTCQQFLKSRQPGIPYYGDDFWDWASVINALFEVRKVSVSAEEVASGELDLFSKAVQDALPGGLTIHDPSREWYGPAMAALAYRVLSKHLDDPASARNTLQELEKQALEKVVGGKYRGQDVSAPHVRWHYGQVVALFGKQAKVQADQLADFSCFDGKMEKSEQVYMLARVLQGAYEVKDKPTTTEALRRLCRCQNLARPLGQGLMGDTVKGSLNVLDALWPNLEDKEKTDIGSMLDALLFQYAKANTIGFIVAIPHEMEELEKQLRSIGATFKRTDTTSIVTHEKFLAVISEGKSVTEVTAKTIDLIKEHRAKWIIMSGIAGSLGYSVDKDGKEEWYGPDVGDVVIATSLAPFGIRNKVRVEVTNARVPFAGSDWRIIPTDPRLFRLAHQATETEELSGNQKKLHEGMTVSRPGIMDNSARKEDCLKEFPGGMAIEEESYPMGMVCLGYGVPYLNIRGISDRANGEKYFQTTNKELETFEQKGAARSAARIAVKVAELLSQEW